jgi:hypothetical protein
MELKNFTSLIVLQLLAPTNLTIKTASGTGFTVDAAKI